jgi:hypothetical protein
VRGGSFGIGWIGCGSCDDAKISTKNKRNCDEDDTWKCISGLRCRRRTACMLAAELEGEKGRRTISGGEISSGRDIVFKL